MAVLERVSRSEMLEAAERLAREYGESLTITAFRRETGWSQWAIFDLFGNWKNLRLAVGLTPEAPRARNRVSREAIVALARREAERLGEKLTERAFLAATGLSGRVVADRFGSWGALRQLVGLQRRARVTRRITQDEAIADLYQAWRRTGDLPKYHQHRWRGGKISASAIRECFGQWSTAVAAYKALLRRKGELPTPTLPEGLTPW